MPGRVEAKRFKPTLPAPDGFFHKEASMGNGEWVTLIGAGSDPDETLNFLRDLWPDIESELTPPRMSPHLHPLPESAQFASLAQRAAARGRR